MAPKVRDFRTYREEDYIPDPKDDNAPKQISGKCKHFDGTEFCALTASFNTPGNKSGKYCKAHASPDMINVVMRRCIFVHPMTGIKCNKTANYRVEGKCTKEYCGEHRPSGVKNPHRDRCEVDGCKVSPSFNFPNSKEVRFCYDHRERGMINVRIGACNYLDEEGRRCKSYKTHGVSGSNKAEFCRKHKLEGMVCIQNERKRKREDDKSNSTLRLGRIPNPNVPYALFPAVAPQSSPQVGGSQPGQGGSQQITSNNSNVNIPANIPAKSNIIILNN